MLSDDATVDDSLGRMTWNFSYTSTIYPTSTFRIHWVLEQSTAFWQPRWEIRVSPTLYRYNITKPNITFPCAWPQISGGAWKKPDGSDEFSMDCAEQRAAVWSDYP
jgi:hypothetical protein